jgi:hypothetical protein
MDSAVLQKKNYKQEASKELQTGSSKKLEAWVRGFLL